MQIIQSLTELQQVLQDKPNIGLVPTMGNLHAGHISLIEVAKQNCDTCIASIYVNPTQFGPSEDFSAYPRTLDADLKQLKAGGTDIVFYPNDDLLYPLGKENHLNIQIPRLGSDLCGNSRPSHFAGVAVVVNKLFQLIRPTIAVFGEKDYQQLLIIKQLVVDFFHPTQILSGPIFREPSGLAMSSRNRYLTPEQLHLAAQLNQHLQQTQEALETGALPLSNFTEHQTSMMHSLRLLGFEPEYYELRTQDTLKADIKKTDTLRLLAAAKLGKTRLIDNRAITVKSI